MEVTGEQLAKAIERKGWYLLRINGSHHIYGKPGERAKPSIPFHGKKALKVGLLHKLMRDAGITENDLR